MIYTLFYKQRQAEVAKNQVKAKQHLEAELFAFENYSHFSSPSSTKNIRTCSKKWAKEQVRLYSRDCAINHNEIEKENEKKITQVWYK